MSCWCFAFLFRCISLVRHFVALSGKKTRRDFSPTLLDIWSYLSKQYEFPWNSKPIIYHHYFKYFVKSTPHDLLFPAEKRGNLKRKVVFQPSCLRGYVYFRGRPKKCGSSSFLSQLFVVYPSEKKHVQQRMFIFNVMAPGTLGHRQFWTCSFATVQNITIRIPEILQALQFAARCWARTGNASGDVIMTLPKFSKWFTWKCMLSKRKESPFFQDAIVRWTPCQTLGGYVAWPGSGWKRLKTLKVRRQACWS